MKTMQRLISTGFATAALVSASVPAMAWTVWPDVDFEWYAEVGKPQAGSTVEVYPGERAGYIWAPGHWENRGTSQVWVAGRYVADDYDAQRAAYGASVQFAQGDAIRDSQGNVIPTSPEAYPVDSALR